MQNILLFIFRLYGGGAERVASNLSIALSERHNVKIAIFDTSTTTYPYKGELIHIRLPFSKDPTKNSVLARSIRLLVLLYKLHKIKRQHKIDVTISFSEQANICNALIGKAKKILSVRTLLSQDLISYSQMNTLGLLVKNVYGRADKIIVPSQIVADDLVNNFKVHTTKLKVIHNYIDILKIDTLASKNIEDPDLEQLFNQRILLNVGRITPAKGQWLLFDILKKIKSEYPDYKLVIIGESESEKDFKINLLNYANDLGLKLYDFQQHCFTLDYDIYLIGFRANPFCFMKKSNVLLFPSIYEGFPNSILEAMQCGLPVIAANSHSGIQEIIPPTKGIGKQTDNTEITKYGILCPSLKSTDVLAPVSSNIVDEWVSALKMLLNDQTLREQLREEGYGRASEFDMIALQAQWEEAILNK